MKLTIIFDDDCLVLVISRRKESVWYQVNLETYKESGSVLLFLLLFTFLNSFLYVSLILLNRTMKIKIKSQ